MGTWRASFVSQSEAKEAYTTQSSAATKPGQYNPTISTPAFVRGDEQAIFYSMTLSEYFLFFSSNNPGHSSSGLPLDSVKFWHISGAALKKKSRASLLFNQTRPAVASDAICCCVSHYTNQLVLRNA